MDAILDDVEQALRTSSLYDLSLRHDILFAHENAVYRALQDTKWRLSTAVTGLDPALTYNESALPYFSHVITYRVPDVAADALLHPDGRGAVNMTRTLAHEVVHSLLQGRFGNEVFRLPMWKQEGYAEYVAASASLLAAPGYDSGPASTGSPRASRGCVALGGSTGPCATGGRLRSPRMNRETGGPRRTTSREC